MSKVYVVLCAYLVLSSVYTLWMVYTLWKEDRQRILNPHSFDKFGFNFRKHGRRDGRFAISATAMILIGLTLPVINIITLIIYLLSVLRSAETRDPTDFSE